ncbi:polypeptide N-acetylgalactosaminyltransferase 8 [Drosophila mojavensis]|uniref:polypeptide N-acetylgalactosaminyltransferase 8 n=1 Tax=Drosophila mojavensis TaxID=7230 RepID=UPI001CD13B64|nr:polypeptide N-acetylgalactosaminyltransferase 8 [Drosophila mojavensis]
MRCIGMRLGLCRHVPELYRAVPVTSTQLDQLAGKSKSSELVLAGLGALGRPAESNWTAEQRLAMESSQRETGYNAWLSERISPERKLFDMRHRSCKKLKYPVENLPAISVIITHHNEQPSVLLRTLSSLRSRTSPRLLREIILVDDGSEQEFAVDAGFEGLVQQQRLPKQLGLMQARLAGAQKAQAEVLVFLDAHIEVTRGWLEPLLAPMLESNRTCTTPVVDTIDYETFAYRRGRPSRGFFDWDFNYIQLPLLKQEELALPAPHENPIMNGGLFAIYRSWFFELGGYDEGLRIWGGEQFELSIKIWLCGGRLLEVPCSRVGHLFRNSNFHPQYKKAESKAIARNYRRVAEVWLDEYKDKLYANMPHLTHVKVGSLKKQKELRQRLRCKPFKWFLDHLAGDFLEQYPIDEPLDYAFGALQSLAAPSLCLERAESAKHPQLLPCDEDLMYPKLQQKWVLSHFRDLHSNSHCLELQQEKPKAEIWLWQCHHHAGNQFWSYDLNTNQIVHGQSRAHRLCLEAQLETKTVIADVCDTQSQRQRWKFGYANERLLGDFWLKVA